MSATMEKEGKMLEGGFVLFNSLAPRLLTVSQNKSRAQKNGKNFERVGAQGRIQGVASIAWHTVRFLSISITISIWVWPNFR